MARISCSQNFRSLAQVLHQEIRILLARKFENAPKFQNWLIFVQPQKPPLKIDYSWLEYHSAKISAFQLMYLTEEPKFNVRGNFYTPQFQSQPELVRPQDFQPLRLNSNC